MITIGLSMKGKLNFIPKEVKEWLIEHNNKYPEINFEINYQEPLRREEEIYEKYAEKCSLIFYFHGISGGVKHILFPYIKEKWFIRIKGEIDETGKLTNSEQPDYDEHFTNTLPAAIRNRIAGMPEESRLKVLSYGIKGIRRSENDPALDYPKEMVSFLLEGKQVSFPQS